MSSFLTREDIVGNFCFVAIHLRYVIVRLFKIETTGVSDLHLLEELEILFVTCDEIASLEECRGLRRLSSM